METKVLPDNLQELQQKVAYAEQVKRITNQIHAAKDLDHILVDLHKEILGLFDAEEITLYAADLEKREILSRAPQLDVIHEIRIPISEHSIAGFTAKFLRPINIADAYNKAELTAIHPSLSFDQSWDKKTGFQTKQVLTYPIVADNKYLMGIIQLLNKKSGGRFTKKDEESVAEIAKSLGIAFANLKKLAKKTPTKFDYLVANNKITQAELDQAIAEARKGQTDMETLLIEKFKVPKEDIGKSLSQFYKCPNVEFSERLLIDPELLKTLNIDYLKKNHWTPLKRDKNAVEILIDDPNDLDKIQDIKRIFPGQSIKFMVGLRRDIVQFLRAATGELETPGGAASSSAASLSEILGELVDEEKESKAEEPTTQTVDENDSAVVRLANQIIMDAYRMNTSDIHVEPYGEKKETVIRFRVDGSCFEYMKVPASYRRAIVSRLKIMANLDIAERRKPQDGKIKFRMGEGKEIELRVATIPTSGVGNEDVVMRILAASEPLPLDKMGFSDRNLRELKAIADKPYGIILCVGPTGSGKTTTLHSVLGYINTPDMKIWTAEDPVEITQYGLRQVQVQPKIGFTFAMAMRAFLRADPDVIMVGEMRDKETAETGIEASLTGHQVFSTLHTNSAVETVTRLLDMGCDPFSFADAMLGVLAQRLCKRICKDCKEEYKASKEEYDELVAAYGQTWWDKYIKKPYDDNFKLYRGKGCEICAKSGFKGRVGLHELLLGTDTMKKMIQTKAKTEDMLRVAMEEGMTTLLQDGIDKTLNGLTTFKEVKAVAMK
ncbi:MAG: GspE/PulE family protein [Nitrospirota bacterium]|nr:GspE/PulE family protein [Nitrospirota bacterium]